MPTPTAQQLVTRLCREEILSLTPYSTARAEGLQENIEAFLDANENPYPLQQPDAAALSLSAYPHPHDALLYQRMSDYLGVYEEQVLITRGADEGIDLLTRAFCPAQRSSVLISPPTFGMYAVSAQIQGAAVQKIPLQREGDEFSLDAAGILHSIQAHSDTRLVFLCSPNNPTANRVNTDTVLTLAEHLSERAFVVVDEAYIAFSGAPSLAEHIITHPNLVILRTLSKEASLAGARCGAVVAAPEVIRVLSGILAPYPLTADTVHTVSAALSEQGREQIRLNIERILTERERLSAELDALPRITRVFPSDANFLLVEVEGARQLVELCARHGVKIRDRSHEPLLSECVRISVGTPEQSELLLQAMRYDR